MSLRDTLGWHCHFLKLLTWLGQRHEACLQVTVLDAHDPWHAKPILVQAREQGVQYFLEHHGGHFYIMTNACEGEEMCIVRANPSELPRR